MNDTPKKYVGNIGVKTITICGVDSVEFLKYENSRLLDDSVILKFNTEEELIEMLQYIVDQSIPFEATAKNDAMQLAALYKEDNLIKGNLIGFFWGQNGASLFEK